MLRGGLNWVADRFGLKAIHRNVLARRVASGAWYFGGGAALATLLGVQVITGMALAMGYSAAPDAALTSVLQITHEQLLGSFVRALHYWSAGLMVLMLVWHLLRQILVGGYKSPREGTWLIGVGLFFLVWIMSLTGYVLRWDQVGITGLKVALTIFSRVPLIGDGLVRFVQGGEEISADTLSRIFAAHVVIIPLIILGLVGFHLYLVIHHGTTAPTEREGRPVESADEQRKVYEEDAHSEARGERFYPTTMSSSGAFAMVVLAIAVLLAVFAGPPALQEPAMSVPESPYPYEEWWFSWFSGLIALLPPWIAWWFPVALPLVLLVILVALPLADRRPHRGIRPRPAAVAFVILTAVGLLYLTDQRRRSWWTAHPGFPPPTLPDDLVLNEGVRSGQALFTAYGCNACHSVGDTGGRFGPDLTALSRPYSFEMLVDYIGHPPDGVAMPAYETRATDEEIGFLAEFVLAIQALPEGRP